MKISIITATYNSAATLRDTLTCIRQQEHPDIEHILIDGGSTDDTLKIAAEFPHLAQVVSGRDKGIYDAMNKGLSKATGDVIGILNSDDVYTGPDVLSLVAKAFADPTVMTSYADLQYVDQADLNKVIRTWKTGPFRKKSFYYGWMPPHPTFFVRREVYDQVGLFDISLRSAADYEMMLRILVRHGMSARYIPRVIVRMRTGGMSNASFRNRLRANKEDRIAWKLNGLTPYFFTLLMKPLRKLPQYFIK
ncbi:MAG: glycosyltransferase family 2 protein [Bacteroidota bacterium]|nr:glycosyltransferase family 2 protein [Bacteroidota bacterium]MDP4215089.1 glycosyltransferase family 2 protein [Bacteroidota bacterium]MDP4244609.1 glycosyltransferase family 2 protein [Bacteroidota bacterium]MDP4253729.1 glycosyltransferase family 2 protein [Bacteroidota bacterium]MDP4258022.1 glycosyltransferase family 2 protein [Bacteroidota bacterium]